MTNSTAIVKVWLVL